VSLQLPLDFRFATRQASILSTIANLWGFAMPEINTWQVFVSLGVPGLALGVFYMLYKKFNWRFPMVPASWVGPIVVLFLLLVFAIVLTSLVLWRPNRTEPVTSDNALAVELAEVERTLSLTSFQYLEAMYLDEADKQIADLESPQFPTSPRLRRIKQLVEILRITLLSSPATGTADHLIERYGRENPNDSWSDLLVATSFYHRELYSKCTAALDGYKPNAEFPGHASARFFQGVCTLRSARERKGDEKTASLALASARFADAYKLSMANNSERYRNLAVSSALYFQGVASFYSGDLNRASEFFLETSKIAREEIRARALNGVGYIAFIRGDLTAAEDALLRSLEQSPKFPIAQSNYGYVLLALDRLEAAEAVFKAIESNPSIARESYRDIILARLALVYVNEVRTKDIHFAISGYAKILEERGFRTFVGIEPEEVRFSYICNEIAEKIYLDRSYYGMEIFAAAYFAKAVEMASLAPDLTRAKAILDTSERNFLETSKVVDPAWFKLTHKSELFSAITKVGEQISKHRSAASSLQ
jgi:tetratricopeptide (TPR) repeat protein